MLKYFVTFAFILVLFPFFVVAEETPGGPGSFQNNQEVTSRYLSAEAQRLIKSEMEIVKQDLKAYQDENFIALDGQMKSTIGRAQKQLIIGALGAFLLGGGIVAIIMFNIAKKYSYEKFVEKQEAFQETQDAMYPDKHVQAMQQDDWGNLQEAVNPTLGQDYGQSFASNNSQFSNWQQQPPYHGGWKWDGGN